MPPDSKTPKTRSRLSDVQRKEICEYAANNRNVKHHEIAEEFKKRYPSLQLDRSTVSKILKKSELYMNLPEESVSANRFRHKPVKYPTLELAMSVWVQQITAGGMPLSDQLLREKGAEFARALEIDEKSLSFSSGWVTKFKKRNQLRRITLHGEAESAPLESIPEARARLKTLLAKYEPDDVYNADETGLFYRMLPNQTLSTDKRRHGKKAVRFIVVFY
jgi:hypothetical protein